MLRILVDTVWIGGSQDDEDDPENWREEWIPAKYIVCPNCHGEGKHSNHLGAFTQEEMYEMGEDFMNDYMAGYFDKPCEECMGKRVVLVPDRENADPDLYKKWETQQMDYWNEHEMHRMEMQAQYGLDY